MFKQRGINCVSTKKFLKSYQVRYKYLRSVNLHGKSLLDNTSEPFTMWMMDLEERLSDAESIHYLVIIKILNLLGGSVGTPGSVQFV